MSKKDTMLIRAMRGTSIFQIAGVVGEEKDKKGENYIKKKQLPDCLGDWAGWGRGRTLSSSLPSMTTQPKAIR